MLMIKVTYFPVMEKRSKLRKENVFVSVIGFINHMTNNKDTIELLMVKREEKGLLTGMWEFPTVLIDDDDDDDETDEKRMLMDDYYKNTFGLDLNKYEIIKRNDIGSVNHKFTHIDMTLYVECVIVKMNKLKDLIQSESKKIRWITVEQMDNIKLCRMVGKVWEKAKDKIKM